MKSKQLDKEVRVGYLGWSIMMGVIIIGVFLGFFSFLEVIGTDWQLAGMFFFALIVLFAIGGGILVFPRTVRRINEAIE